MSSNHTLFSFVRKPFAFLSLISLFAMSIVFADNVNGQRATDYRKPTDTKADIVTSPLTALLTDDFSYAAGTLLTANGWANHSGTSNFIPVSNSGLTYTGYAGSGIGNGASLTTTGEDVNRTFAAQTSGSVYAAAMINLSASQVNGDYFFHLIDGAVGSGSFKGRLFAKKDPASTNFAIGIQKSSTANAAYSAFTFVPGTTYLVIVKYTFVAGAANDTVELFINPTLGGAEPAATLTAVLGTDADVVDINGVALRQGNAANAPTLTIDGIRIGTAWADVAGSSTAAGVFVSGRVLTSEGRGITNAVVTITGNSLSQPRNAVTGRGGSYIFDDLEPGETYIVTVRARRFMFSNPSQVISIVDNVSDADFVADGVASRGR